MKWEESSQLVAGLALAGRISLTAIRPEILMPPYNEIVEQLKEGKTATEDLIETIGLNPIQLAMEREKSINGLGKTTNWLQLLEKSYSLYSTGQQLEKIGRKMVYGEEPDAGKLTHLMTQFKSGESSRYPLSEIESGEIPFVSTGWPVIDDHLMGFPEVGLIIVGGNPGVGKTSFLVKVASKYVKKHKKMQIGVYSLEMIFPEIASRFREVENLSKEEESRIIINTDALIASEVIADAASIENLGMIIIDFADYMGRGETTVSSMEAIYRELAIGSKQLGCPVVLLSQLSRKYSGGIPRPTDVRWTSLAEILGWMVLMLYNPSIDFYDERDEEILPVQDGTAYIICWKVRGGFRLHPDDSPGAIATGFKGKRGWWTDKSKWFSLKKER